MVAKAKPSFILLAALSVLLALPAAASSAGPPDPVIGQPFPISANFTNNEFDVAVAHDPGRNRFLVVFNNDSALNARCVDALGATVATFVVPAVNGINPDVVYNGWLDEYLVVWDEAFCRLGRPSGWGVLSRAWRHRRRLRHPPDRGRLHVRQSRGGAQRPPRSS
jgi:hypothetical protein